MPLRLQEVDYSKDFDELIECEWISYENPNQPFFALFFPIHGDGPDARAEAIKEGTARQLEWHKSDPTSYWQKVVNEEGKIVAGALWKICPTNPFEHEEHLEVSWYAEGGARDYVSQALKLFEAPRARMAQRPQVCMYTTIISRSHIIDEQNTYSRGCQFLISSSPTPITGVKARGILY